MVVRAAERGSPTSTEGGSSTGTDDVPRCDSWAPPKKRIAKRVERAGAKLPRWHAEEEEILRCLVQEIGTNDWAEVARRMPGERSKSGVQQHWYASLASVVAPPVDRDFAQIALPPGLVPAHHSVARARTVRLVRAGKS